MRAVASDPSGTVTFLFTDIVGSTERWERYAAAMELALACHDAIVRGAIESRGGHVFKTVGDAFCAVFGRAEEAAEAALAAQAELARADFAAVGGLHVRMAIHSGTAVERDDDYFGPTVNRVARLLAVGHGGQILLTSPAQALLNDPVDTLEATVLDLGEHALRDVRTSERIFQLSPAGLPPTFPPLRTPLAMPGNLPFATADFVGREDDAARLSVELGRSRAVTLVGTGGIGKTRCAVHVAAAAAQRFRQGVRLVELGSVTGPEFVGPAIAAAFDLSLTADEPAVDTIVRAFQWRNVLIVLDNCEHVVAEAAHIVDRLLQRCPETTVLATSREPLGVRGESVYRLRSLAVPPAGVGIDAESAQRFDAVALFARRAREAAPHFTLDDDNVRTVAAICRRLDGIALAIELAANRLRTLALDELLERLHQRFRLLKGGARTGLPRQQTVRALVDWSYDLLSHDEQTAFRQLAVFPNRFDLDGALAVCGSGTNADDYGALDLLESLVDKSLVAVDHRECTNDWPEYDASDDERPYRLLETLREYAAEKLATSGEADAAYARLTVRSLARARAADECWATSKTTAWRRTYEKDLEDLRTALGWALEQRHDLVLGVALAAASRRIWGAVAPVEGRRWMLLAQAALNASFAPPECAAVWLGVAQMHVALGQYATALAAARRAAETNGATVDAARFEADMYAGFSLALLGDTTGAKALLAPALAGLEALGCDHLAAFAAIDLASAHATAEEFEEARALFFESLGRFRQFDDSSGIETVTINLSELEFRSGDVAAAVRLTADAIANRSDDAPPLMLANLAAYLCALGRFDQARTYARESLSRAETLGQEVDVTFSVQRLAAVATFETAGRSDERHATLVCAARLLGFVDRALERLSCAREFTEQSEYDRTIAALQTALAPATLETALREGAGWDERRAISEARRL